MKRVLRLEFAFTEEAPLPAWQIMEAIRKLAEALGLETRVAQILHENDDA